MQYISVRKEWRFVRKGETLRGQEDTNLGKMLGILARRASPAASRYWFPWRESLPITIPSARAFSVGVLPDTLDRSSDLFTGNSKAMDDLVSQLHSHIRKVLYFYLSVEYLIRNLSFCSCELNLMACQIYR